MAQAIEETAAAVAEEGEVAVAAEGVGGAGYLGGLAEGAAVFAPTAGEAGAMAATAGVGAATAGGRGTGWVLENTLFRPQQGSEDAAVQNVRS